MRLSTAASAARSALSTAVASAAPDAAKVGTTPCASVDLRACIALLDVLWAALYWISCPSAEQARPRQAAYVHGEGDKGRLGVPFVKLILRRPTGDLTSKQLFDLSTNH